MKTAADDAGWWWSGTAGLMWYSDADTPPSSGWQNRYIKLGRPVSGQTNVSGDTIDLQPLLGSVPVPVIQNEWILRRQDQPGTRLVVPVRVQKDDLGRAPPGGLSENADLVSIADKHGRLDLPNVY